MPEKAYDFDERYSVQIRESFLIKMIIFLQLWDYIVIIK